MSKVCAGCDYEGAPATSRICSECPGLSTPATLLATAAATYTQRNALYGDSYLVFGKVMAAMLPAGIELSGEKAFNRFGVFTQCVSKLTRYAANLQAGGHQDSAHDLCVYAAMLESLTEQNDEDSGL